MKTSKTSLANSDLSEQFHKMRISKRKSEETTSPAFTDFCSSPRPTSPTTIKADNLFPLKKFVADPNPPLKYIKVTPEPQKNIPPQFTPTPESEKSSLKRDGLSAFTSRKLIFS